MRDVGVLSGRAAFRRCVLVAEDGAPAPLRRSVSEAAEFLSELTECPVPVVARGGARRRRTGRGLTLAVGADATGSIMRGAAGPRVGSREGFRIRIETDNDGPRASVAGATLLGTARGLSRLLGMIEIGHGGPCLPPVLDLDTAPRLALRGMHLNGWAANHPYSFRCWTEEEWKRYVDILFHEAVNVLFLWPSIDIIPLPLSREDEAYLEEVRRVVAYAREERGMEVWLLLSANRIALDNCGVADPRLRPYWLPEAQVDLDPGRPDHLERILRSREPLYRIVDNADGFVIIDSDPGGWNGSPVGAYIELLRRTRAMVDTLARDGPRVKLVSWLWQGWGYTSWDPSAREPVIAETVRLMRDRLPEPWMLIAGTGHYFPYLRRLGVLDKTIALPYGAIEAEPSLPFTNVDPASINGALDGVASCPELAGAMGNVQCPLLQLPQVHHLMRGFWQGQAGDEDVEGLSRLLYPGAAADVAAAFAALNATRPGAIGDALERMNALTRPPLPAGGLMGRLLFPSRLQALADLASQLELRQVEAELAGALEAGGTASELGPLVSGWFRQCLRWEQKHGYFGVLRTGRLKNLFPRPPIPRDTMRTWPPFVPYAPALRRALIAADDPRGESFFAPMRAELERAFEPERVRRGCIEAMQEMMERDPSR